MNVKAALTTAKSKTVVQDVTLRGLGTALIGAGLMGYQNGTTLEERALGVGVCIVGLVVYVIKDVLAQQ